MTEPILIDGSQGEGGGQILRSSLALALVTSQTVTIDNIRAKRKKPGLMRQHLTAVAAAAQIARASVEGAHIGSGRLVFRPGAVRAGDYNFSVGTAGSATLVLQTVLPALMLAEGESRLTLEGGTHNPLAPPYDFLAKAYLPLVNRLGPVIETQLIRPGFYPAGGGRMTVQIRPTQRFATLELTERGEIIEQRGRILLANLPEHIAQRECAILAKNTGWPESSFTVEGVDALGPGNVVLIELESAHVTEVFCGFGRLGVSAEQVAITALDDARENLAANVPVGQYLADQLMLPLAIAACHGGGGQFHTMVLTRHSSTHLDIIRRFLAVPAHVEKVGNHNCVRFGG